MKFNDMPKLKNKVNYDILQNRLYQRHPEAIELLWLLRVHKAKELDIFLDPKNKKSTLYLRDVLCADFEDHPMYKQRRNDEPLPFFNDWCSIDSASGLWSQG